MARPIYLDHLSTTPCDPAVVEAMLPYFGEAFGHPGSPAHAYGWEAEKALETARARVADLIGAEPAEIVFTSGGTEADNLAIKGVGEQLFSKGRHVVTTAIENRPVLDSCAWLERRGFSVTRVAPDETGRVSVEAVEAALTEDTILVSVQAANHEVGTLQPLSGIGRLCAERDVLFHTDAASATPWTAIDVKALGIHLLSISGHRMYGPKGIGALYVQRRKPRVRLQPRLHGGGHERGLRSGTVNVPGAVGLGVAAELCRTQHEADAARVGTLRDAFEDGLRESLSDVRCLGNPATRLPNVSAFAVPHVEGEAFVTALTGLAIATGSACTSATPEPSHVLRAMGLDKETVSGAVRLSLGRTTTPDEMDAVLPQVVDAAERLRAARLK
ncbi:MAG: cysteine desulfurase family protein [Planctomycetota bacterium]|nr:cysteine desulfurase family protein [Planctomycetota bacterium]